MPALDLLQEEVSSSQSDLWYRVGPTRPRLAVHANIIRQSLGDRTVFVLEDPASTQYFRLSEAAYWWLGLLDDIDSAALRGNPLQDPHRREVPIYLPPGYDEQSSRRYATVYLLPSIMDKLVPKLLKELKPGARVVSHDYPLKPWEHDKVLSFDFQEKLAISGTTMLTRCGSWVGFTKRYTPRNEMA